MSRTHARTPPHRRMRGPLSQGPSRSGPRRLVASVMAGVLAGGGLLAWQTASPAPAAAAGETVQFNTDVSVPARLETVWVTATTPGVANAWIDFDRDGVYEPHEQIVSNRSTVVGANQFTYTVPSAPFFVPGATTARFEFTVGGLTTTQTLPRTLYDAESQALSQCPDGTVPVPVGLIQNPSFEQRTGNFANTSANSTISFATNWFDRHPTGGQYHVFSPTFDSGPGAASMPVRAGADAYAFEGGHSLGAGNQGEGATNTLLAPLNPDATYVGFFSMAAGGYSRTGNGYIIFFGTDNRNTGSVPGAGVVTPTAANTERLFTTPVVRYAGNGVRPTWTLNTFTLNTARAWPFLRVEVRNANPAGDGSTAGQVWMNFDDFHMFECQPVRDFGDAPDSYGTSLATDGPRHLVPGYNPATGTASLMLGRTIDDEDNGIPTAGADGDDDTGLDDEDGVAAPIEIVSGLPGTIRVTASNATAQEATIAAWIDLDGDGTFEASELATAPLPSGSIDVVRELRFPGGTLVQAGTYARVRVLPGVVAAPRPTGLATAGEVEDYPVAVSHRTLSISKSTTAAASAVAGDRIRYTVVVTNTGSWPYTAESPAVVTDDLGGILDDAAYSGDATATIAGEPVTAPTLAGTTLSWAGALAPGESVVITYDVVLTLAGDGVLDNVACVPARDAAGADPCARTSTPIPPSPALALTKSVSPVDAAHFQAGNQVTYTFVVTNAGNVVVTDPTVEETAFAGFGAHPVPQCPATPALAPGEQMTCTAVYTITQQDVDTFDTITPLTNSAQARGTARGGVVLSPLAHAELPADPEPAISLEKSAQLSTLRAAGDVVDYTFLVTNTGNVTLTRIAVVEDEFDGSGVSPTITCPLDAQTPLSPGQTVTCTAVYSLTQADVDRGTVANLATATGVSAAGVTVSDTDDALVTIEHQPALALVKAATPTQATHAGEDVRYTFTITNTGNVTLDDLAIAEGEFTGSGAVTGLHCPGAPVAPGESAECSAAYRLTQTDVDAGSVRNTATASGRPPAGDRVASPPAAAEVLILPSASIELVKSADPRETVAGTTVRYSFVITNSGQSTLAEIDVTEQSFTGSGQMSDPDCPATELAPGASMVCTAEYVTTPEDVAAGAVDNTAVATGLASGGRVMSGPASAIVTLTEVPPPGANPPGGPPDLAATGAGAAIAEWVALAAIVAALAGVVLMRVSVRARASRRR